MVTTRLSGLRIAGRCLPEGRPAHPVALESNNHHAEQV